jgi:hypothetical protein
MLRKSSGTAGAAYQDEKRSCSSGLPERKIEDAA